MDNLRKLDVVGRWGEKAFLILLPETDLASAKKAARKLKGIRKAKMLIYNEQAYEMTCEFRAVEYEPSLEETLDRVCSWQSR